jgi:hypothetical protein
MRCASVSIGIEAYEQEAYRTSWMRLRYAAADAAAFHQYACTAWDDATGVHHLLTDGNAASAAVSGVFEEISKAGRFDILVVYLSGHGEAGTDGVGWFCLTDAQPGAISLGSGQLDDWLGKVSADRVLLLVDCCYAEAAVSGARLFGRLGGSVARLFVASARAGQQSWEDDDLKRSLFSDVLLRALSSDSDIAELGAVDLEARLLPRLRDQVPLNAAARKRGAVQEPVSGGYSIAPTKLPTVNSKSLGRELSVAETVRRRARRLLAAAAIILVAALLLTDGLAYHLAVAGSGEILLRPGLAAVYGLLPFHLGREADTGVALSDMDPTNDALLVRLGRGAVSGFANHLDHGDLRPWLAALEPGLKRERKESLAALIRGASLPFAPDDEAPPVREAAFLSVLTGRAISEIGRTLYPLEVGLDIGCADDASRRLDFERLLAGTDVFVRDASWIAETAPADIDRRADVLFRLVLLAAYRSFHEKSEENRAAELQAFAAAAWRLVSTAPNPDGFTRAAAARLQPMRRGWCAVHTDLALSFLTPADGAGTAAQAWLVALFRAPYDDDRLAEPHKDEELAAVALAEIGRHGLLSQPTLETVEKLARVDGLDMFAVAPASVLVMAIAPHQGLPRSLVSGLFTKMQAPPADSADFSPLGAFVVLAANAPYLQPDERAQLAEWAAREAPEQRTMSEFHRGLGYIAVFTGKLENWQREILEARLSPLSRFPPRAVNYRGTTIIHAGDDDALVALGRAAQVTDIPLDTAERLANAASGRPLLEGRQELLKGLGAEWYRAIGPAALAPAIRDRLSRARLDGARVSLEAEVAAERVAALTLAERQQVVTQLVARWQAEREPEIRAALATVLGLAAGARDL